MEFVYMYLQQQQKLFGKANGAGLSKRDCKTEREYGCAVWHTEIHLLGLSYVKMETKIDPMFTIGRIFYK